MAGCTGTATWGQVRTERQDLSAFVRFHLPIPPFLGENARFSGSSRFFSPPPDR
jgi:hypothetical protein